MNLIAFLLAVIICLFCPLLWFVFVPCFLTLFAWAVIKTIAKRLNQISASKLGQTKLW